MQLSVACNLIPDGVRMRTRRWIISHRCSRMAIYVYCCNARISFHNVYSKGLVLVCQLPICDLFTQHVISLWRDTASELWTPVLFSILLNQSPQKLCLLSCNLLFCNNFPSTRYV